MTTTRFNYGLFGAVGLASALSLLPGCSDDSQDQTSEEVLYSPESFLDAGAGAGLMGTLVLDGNCLYLDGNNGRTVPIWPFGSEWNDEPNAVAVGTDLFSVGDVIAGTGGYYPIDDASDYVVPEHLGRAKACSGENRFELAVFQGPGSVSEVK